MNDAEREQRQRIADLRDARDWGRFYVDRRNPSSSPENQPYYAIRDRLGTKQVVFASADHDAAALGAAQLNLQAATLHPLAEHVGSHWDHDYDLLELTSREEMASVLQQRGDAGWRGFAVTERGGFMMLWWMRPREADGE